MVAVRAGGDQANRGWCASWSGGLLALNKSTLGQFPTIRISAAPLTILVT